MTLPLARGNHEPAMKSLLLMRHAKSSWEDSSLPDHDRPLNNRGKRDAPRMGDLLREKRLVPDRIISSTAARARRTAREVARRSGCPNAVQLEADLYHKGPEAWVELLRRVSREVGIVMMIGHNPGFERFLSMLTGRHETLPTAAIAHIRLPLDCWESMDGTVAGTLPDVWRPKEL